MTTLAEYLTHKRDAFRALRSRVLSPGYEPAALRAYVTAQGRSGVRRIRLRDHQVLADGPRDFVGYNLGPSSPELALGALGSCLAHSYLIQAAAQGVALDSLEVEVTGQIDQRAGEAGYEVVPREPHSPSYAVHLDTSASDEAVDRLHEAVERLCPVLNLLRHPQAVSGPVRRAPVPAARALSPEGVVCWCGRPLTASMCRSEVVADLRQRRPSVEQASRVGMDASKHVLQLHGVDASEKVVLRRRLRRKEMVAFFEKLAPSAVAACGASHHWARLPRSFGHEVKLIAPRLVKPCVKRGKNDAADAEALCEATSRPTMRFAPVRTAERQAALMLMGLREQLVASRTQLSNATRGHAMEFGLTVAKEAHLEPLLERIQADDSLPIMAREPFAIQAEGRRRLGAQVAEVDAKLAAWQRSDECSRRLVKIPGVGPIGAALPTTKAPAPELLKSGRRCAAWIGLTPKDRSTAGKARSGVITRAGDETLRSVLVVGAAAAIQQAQRRGKALPWLAALLKRKPPKLVAVALANKMARIAWKLMVTGQSYAATSAPAALADAA